MRALLIGVGKAGSRIVNMLTAHDLVSGVTSVRSYIFDSNQEFLTTMESIDPEKRILLLPNGLDIESCKFGTDFDVSNITGYLADTIVDEADAVFVCSGLGGKMAETLPSIISQLHNTLATPIFSILTIPARNEGARVSARAAAELEAIRNVASAEIIFDNETWIVRLEEERAVELAESHEIQGDDGIIIRNTSKLSIADVQTELNELLTRRVELLLRAGEITEKGIETAEAVLDAGEVLNTLTDTDIVSIGYAAERLPKKLLGFLNRFRMEKYLLEEGQKRTARIVNLAKKAVYEEVSIPCDLTTANKALILITGPSNELSMKGFQTIRRWIDNSIKGLEMRAGDYPVKSTKDVGVIIVLAGIENVPRIAELTEIRISYEEEIKKKYFTQDDLFSEKQEPEIRAATDKEIFEEGTILNLGRDTPVPSEYEKYLGYAGSAMMGVSATAGVAYAGYTSANNQHQKYEDTSYQDTFVSDYDDSDLYQESDILEEESLDTDNEYFEEDKQENEYPANGYQPDEHYDNDDEFFEERNDYSDDKTDIDNTPYPNGEVNDSNDLLDDLMPDDPSLPNTPSENDNIFEDEEDATYSDEKTDGDDASYTENKTDNSDDLLDEYVPDTSSHSTDSAENEDVFEENPVPVVHSPNPTSSPAPSATIAAGTVAAGAVAAKKLILPKNEKQPAKRKSDPQIVLGGKKKKKQEFESSIPLPKRNKQPDMVLAGQADLGKRKVLKEGMDRTAIGSGRRPKETDGNVSVGSGQRPKETDGNVSVGSGQRPKETDGNVSVGSGQRPKETDGNVSISARKRPKESGGPVSVGTKMKPNDAGRAVSVGTKMKPNDAMGNVTVGTKQRPKEIGNAVKVIEKKPLQTDVWKTIREAQKKRDDENSKSSGSSYNLKWM